MFPQNSAYSLTSFSCPLQLVLFFWNGSKTTASHSVCLFIYTAIPTLIQTNVCLHSTHRKGHVFLHVYFPEIVHQIAFLHPFCNLIPSHSSVPGENGLLWSPFQKEPPTVFTPHILCADIQDLRYSVRRKGTLTVTSTKK